MFTPGLYIVVDRRSCRITHVVENGLNAVDPSLDNNALKDSLTRMDDGEMISYGCFTIIRGKGGVTIDELQKRHSN